MQNHKDDCHKMGDKGSYKTKWTIRRYASDQDFKDGKLMEEPSEIEGNLLLEEGITAFLNLLVGNAEAAYSNANANLGVGDSNTAAAATQTDLLGTSKSYNGMEATYPQISGQTVTFRAVFGSSEANHSWQEFTVSNSTDGTGDNLNRKVSNQGTKASGQTWTIDLEITFS